MAEYGKTYEDLIGDWGTFGDLDGFGTKARESPMLGGDEFVDFDGGAEAGAGAGAGFGVGSGTADDIVCVRFVTDSDGHPHSSIN